MADSATDKSTVNLVVLLLGILAIIGLAGLIWLIHDGTPAATLVAVSTPVAAITGALAAVLSSTRSVDLGGLKELDQAQQASFDQSQAAAQLHAQLSRPTGDFNPPEYPGDHEVQTEPDPESPEAPPEQLV